MSEGIKEILRNCGLTEIETEIYIFLAKHGPLRNTEITKRTKKDRAEIYRVLKNLETKGLVEKTLQAPTRFISTPFERAIDSFIKYKRDEANRVEKAKKELVEDWNHITKTTEHPALEKFVVIEGIRKIYPRIAQMIKETQHEFSSVSSVSGYIRAEQFGIFDEVLANHSSKKINFKFISEISNQNLGAFQKLRDIIPKNLTYVRTVNPDFGFKSSPRMAIRDNEEIFLFINPLSQEALSEKDDIGLWTNCKTIVQTFAAVFDDLWRNSTDLINSPYQMGDSLSKLQPSRDAEVTKGKYFEAIHLANKEILAMTSPNGLNGFLKISSLFKEPLQKGTSIKIMAPLVKDNFEAAKKLAKFCQIRHVPMNNKEVTIIDEKNLFQIESSNNIENIGFNNNNVVVKKTRSSLIELWEKSTPLSETTLETLMGPSCLRPSDIIDRKKNVDNILFTDENQNLNEKEIVEKILRAKRIPVKNITKDLHVMYASGGSAIVHPPKSLDLPDLMFEAQHIDKHSGLGQGDALVVFIWLETPNGYAFVPAGGIGDNPKGVAFRKAEFAGFPAERNYRLVKKDVLQVRAHGNKLFIGWTVPIPLLPPRYVLPPATLLIEGYGDVITKGYTTVTKSGFKNKTEINGFDAFVTFMHPSSNYSGAGTDGFLFRDLILTITHPAPSPIP